MERKGRKMERKGRKMDWCKSLAKKNRPVKI